MAGELGQNKNLEFSTRLILTPFPAKDVVGRTEFTKQFQDGRNHYSMTLKTMLPAKEFAARASRDMIPTAEIGRNIHAMLLGDLRRATIEAPGSGPTVLTYPSFAHVAERIHCSYNPKNVEKIDDIFFRLAWATISYVHNGRAVNIIGGAEGNGIALTRLTRFADQFSRETTKKGKPVSFSLVISPEYVETMGSRMTTVKEDVYMGLESSFAKDLYVWTVYASRWAAAKQVPSFEASLERLVRQFTESSLTRNNLSYYKAQVGKWLKEIEEKDPTVKGVFEDGKVTIKARERLVIERDATDPQRVGIPTVGAEEYAQSWEQNEQVIALMKKGVSPAKVRALVEKLKNDGEPPQNGVLDFS